MQQAGLLPPVSSSTQVLVTRMDPALADEYLKLATELREAGLNSEVFYGGGKFGKQMKYADRAGIRFAAIMGENEHDKDTVSIKDLVVGDQLEVGRTQLARTIKERLQ